MESQLLSKLQHTQKRENEVFSQLTGAIREALQSQKDRLAMKQQKNDIIRKNYHEPPKLSQWEEVLRNQVANSVLEKKPPKFPGIRSSITDYNDKAILQTIDPRYHPSKSVMTREHTATDDPTALGIRR